MKRKAPALRLTGWGATAPVELIRGCCHRFLAGFRFQGTEPVCSDPPCVQSTRRADRRYRHDCTDDGHVALLDLLKGLPCQVMVSGHPSDYTDDCTP